MCDAVHLEPVLHGVERTGDSEGMPDDRVHRPAGPGHGVDGLADFRQVGGAPQRATVCRPRLVPGSRANPTATGHC